MANNVTLGYFRINDPDAPPAAKYADSQGHQYAVGVITWPLQDDCDEITIDLLEKNVLAPTMVGLRLQTMDGMWFKGIEAHRNGDTVSKVEVDKGPGMTDPMLIAVPDLDSTTLYFIKAKAAGAHTDVYHLRAQDLKAFAGSIVTFSWRNDHC